MKTITPNDIIYTEYKKFIQFKEKYMVAFDGKFGHEGVQITAEDSKSKKRITAIKDVNGKYYSTDTYYGYHINDELSVIEYLPDEKLAIIDFEKTQQKMLSKYKKEKEADFDTIKKSAKEALSFEDATGYSNTKQMKFTVINQIIQNGNEVMPLIKYENGNVTSIAIESLKKKGIAPIAKNKKITCFKITFKKTDINQDDYTRISIRLPKTNNKIWINEKWIFKNGNTYTAYLPKKMNYMVNNGQSMISAKEVFNQMA